MKEKVDDYARRSAPSSQERDREKCGSVRAQWKRNRVRHGAFLFNDKLLMVLKAVSVFLVVH